MATAPKIIAVLALQGTKTISVQAKMRSLFVVNTRVPIMAGTLQPAPVSIGMMALKR